MALHKIVQAIEVLGLDGPDLSHDVEEHCLGARRSGQTTFVRPPIVHIGELHHVSKLHLL